MGEIGPGAADGPGDPGAFHAADPAGHCSGPAWRPASACLEDGACYTRPQLRLGGRQMTISAEFGRSGPHGRMAGSARFGMRRSRPASMWRVHLTPAARAGSVSFISSHVANAAGRQRRPGLRTYGHLTDAQTEDTDHARQKFRVGCDGRRVEGTASRHGNRLQGHGRRVRGLHRTQRRVRQLHLLGGARLDRDGAQLVLRQRARHHVLRLPLPDVQPPRRHQARRRRQQARVQQLLLVRHAVLGRCGHRAAVLRHRRADVLLRQHPALGLSEQSVRRSRDGHRHERGARDARHARHLLPLGIPRLGGVRDDRALPRLLRVPEEAAADASFVALPGDRRQDLRPGRSRGRPAGGLRHGVRRRHLARARGESDGGRPQPPVRRRPRNHHPDHPDRRHLHRGDAVRGVRGRQRDPHHLGVEHLALRGASRLLPVRGAGAVADGILRHHVGRLPLARHPDGLPDLQRAGRVRLAGGMDHLLLGLVDLLGALRRDVHRADQPRADHPGVHGRGDVRADHAGLLLAVHLRRQRHVPGADRRGRSGHGGDRPARP